MKYSKKLAEKLAEAYCSGDQDIREICKHFGISAETFYHWKKTKAEFSDMIQVLHDQRLDRLGQMALSGLAILLQKHEYEEVTTEYIEGEPAKDGQPAKPKIKAVKRVKKFIMPNARIVTYVADNRMPSDWRTRQQTDHTNNGDSFNFSNFLIAANTPETDDNEDHENREFENLDKD